MDGAETKDAQHQELAELRVRVQELERAAREAAVARGSAGDAAAYTSFVQNFRGIAFRGRLDFTPIFFHGAVEEVTGYTAEEFTAGTPRWDQVIHPDDLTGPLAEDVRLIHDVPGYVSDREYRIVRKDGQIRHVHECIQNIVDASGQPYTVQGVIYDITERKAADAELQFQAQLLNRIADYVWATDTNGRFSYVNAAFADLLHRSPERLVGSSVLESSELAEAGPALAGVHQKALATRSWRGPMALPSPDGEARWLEIRTGMLEGPDGQSSAVFAIGSDVTEQRKAQRDKEALEARLIQAQRMEALGRLAGGVAHDFNNLLTVVAGYAEVALRSLEGNDRLRAELEQIRAAAERGAALTAQLLAFGRRQLSQPQVMDLNATIAESREMLSRLIGENIELRCTLAEQLEPVVADPNQIDQILFNLAANARDAMEQGGTLTIETANITLDEDFCRRHPDVAAGDFVRLTVADTGTGMNEQTLQRAFEPFFTTKDRGRGTGLGLSTVDGIVKQSGGSIRVHSRPRAGTTVIIDLPRASNRVVRRPDAAAAASPSGTETILLVEDDDLVRALTERILTQHGYHVLAAGGADEALQLWRKEAGAIDLLLTDVVMPRMNGPELLERLRAEQPAIRALFMSGHTDDIIAKHGALEGGFQLLQKPFSVKTLTGTVRRALERS